MKATIFYFYFWNNALKMNCHEFQIINVVIIRKSVANNKKKSQHYIGTFYKLQEGIIFFYL